MYRYRCLYMYICVISYYITSCHTMISYASECITKHPYASTWICHASVCTNTYPHASVMHPNGYIWHTPCKQHNSETRYFRNLWIGSSVTDRYESNAAGQICAKPRAIQNAGATYGIIASFHDCVSNSCHGSRPLPTSRNSQRPWDLRSSCR